MMYKRQLEYHINGYRLQYWLYAVLNAKFGRQVTFARDSLHARYEVNRHGFTIQCSNPIEVRKIFLEMLQKCGYVTDEKYNANQDSVTKKTLRQTGKESLHVSASVTNNKEVSVSVFAYWHVLP